MPDCPASPTDGWFDTHVHLDSLNRSALPAELAAARAAGGASWLVPGVVPSRWDDLLAVVTATPGAWAAPGVHPAHAAAWTPAVAERLSRLLAHPRVVAIGEIGLDTLVDVPHAEQEAALRGQLRLAVAHGLPVAIHCRKASERLLRLLDEEGADRVGGIWHGFSGSVETARAALRRNFAIGCGGVVTYAEARRAPLVVRTLPDEWLVLESDAPDLAPEPRRGQPNRPCWLDLVATRVAELRHWSRAETIRTTTANARRVLRLPAGNERE